MTAKQTNTTRPRDRLKEKQIDTQTNARAYIHIDKH